MEEKIQTSVPDTVIIPPEIIAQIETLQKKPQSNAGRPTVMTDGTLEKLKEAFLWGCTDREACLYADINPQTLYNYQKANPEFIEQKELWKENPFILARKTINKALEDDADIAIKYMERKKKDEFAQRIEQTGKDGNAIEMTLDKLENNRTDYADIANRAKAAMDATPTPQG